MLGVGTGEHLDGEVPPGGWGNLGGGPMPFTLCGAKASTRQQATLGASLQTPFSLVLETAPTFKPWPGLLLLLLWRPGGAQRPWGHHLFLIFQGKILTSGAT